MYSLQGKLWQLLPAIFLSHKRVWVSYRYFYEDNTAWFYTNPLVIGKKHKIIVSQKWVNDKLMLEIFKDDQLIKSVENVNGKNLDNVKLYLSNPYHYSIGKHAEISLLKIGNEFTFSSLLKYFNIASSKKL